MVRPTFAVIDLAAIRHNVREIGDFIAPSEVCAVVKADGYGHGDAPVAGAALEAGATRLAVALVEEGIRLREAGIDAQIIVLSEPDPASAPDFAKWALTPTVYSHDFAEALGRVNPRPLVHVKVDTGMHRVGVAPDRVDALVKTIKKTGLEVEGLFTHFPVADSDPVFTRGQIEKFTAISERYDVPTVHMANTPGALLFPEARADFARIGLGTYGLHPCDETRDLVDLRPAMSIVSAISHVQRLPAGARLSYGRARPLERDSTVATIPIGYADGLWRQLSDQGSALIGGQVFPLAGTVTMDQAMVDVGDAEVAVGDEVVLIGNQGDRSITADDWAQIVGTISYEIVCSIGPRVPRRYSS